MVLAQPVGKRRSFLRGFLLTLATVGFYAVYWNYKIHDEVYKQFELAREGRDEGVIWYILGLIFPPFIFAYLWIFVSNVAYVRARMGLPLRSTPRSFMTLVGIGVGTFLIGWFALVFGTAALEGATDAPVDEAATAAVATATLLFLLGTLLLFVLAPIAYSRLQADVNELWAAYDQRIATLRDAPPVGRLTLAPELGPHPSTWTATLDPDQRPPA